MKISMDDYREFRRVIIEKGYREARNEKQNGAIDYTLSDNAGNVILSREADRVKDTMNFQAFITIQEARKLPLKNN